MKPVLPPELESSLSGELSHLVLQSGSAQLARRLRDFLRLKGVAIVKESEVRDTRQHTWRLFSLARPSASILLLELAEQGFAGDLAGIDAKKG